MRGIFLVWRIRIVILLILALLYLLSPLDFIPERVFGILGLLEVCIGEVFQHTATDTSTYIPRLT